MTHALFPDNDPHQRRKIKRPVVSDADGMREGGLVFVIVLIFGFILAAVVNPAAVTSFWVWVGLLCMCIAVALGAQKGVARLSGHKEEGEDDT